MTLSLRAVIAAALAGIPSGIPAWAQSVSHWERTTSVFKDFILPIPSAPTEEIEWGLAGGFVGDGNSNTYPEILVSRYSHSATTGSSEYLLALGEISKYVAWPRDPGVFGFIGGGGTYQASVAIQTPYGPEMTGLEIATPFGTYLFAYAGGPPRGPVQNPPGAYAIMSLDRAGDINKDGWDDIFCYGINPSGIGLLAGLADGRTLQQVWSVADLATPAYSPFLVMTYDPEGPPDLDGDGIADFILGYNLAVVPPPLQYLIRVYSGATGAFLWERILMKGGTMVPCTGSDLDGDGTADLALLFPHSIGANAAGYYWRPGELTVLSGRDGSEIWTVPSMSVDPQWPGPPNIADYFTPSTPIAFEEDSDGDGIDDIVFSVMRRFSNPYVEQPVYVATFSGLDGTYLGLAERPTDGKPWTDDPLGRPTNRGIFALGDIDDDGWMEFGLRIELPSYDLDGRSPYATGLGILSRPSLVIDEEAAPGDTLRYRLHLPAAGGCDYTLLASTTFSYRQGLWLGDWNTQLGPSRLLTATMARQPFRGTLGPSGKAGGVIQVPPRPVLSGLTIYWRAIVTDPAVPNAVRTQSNLARTEMR